MHLDPHINANALIRAAIVVCLVGFAIYRRIRRSIGRQRLRPTSFTVRLILLVLICAGLLVAVDASGLALLYAAVGAGLGVLIAVYALRHTRMESTPDGIYFTGHPYIGLGVAALLVGRILYRVIAAYPVMQNAAASMNHGTGSGAAFRSSVANPLTIGFTFIMAGYYVAYYGRLLARARKLAPQPPS